MDQAGWPFLKFGLWKVKIHHVRLGHTLSVGTQLGNTDGRIPLFCLETTVSKTLLKVTLGRKKLARLHEGRHPPRAMRALARARWRFPSSLLGDGELLNGNHSLGGHPCPYPRW